MGGSRLKSVGVKSWRQSFLEKLKLFVRQGNFMPPIHAELFFVTMRLAGVDKSLVMLFREIDIE